MNSRRVSVLAGMAVFVALLTGNNAAVADEGDAATLSRTSSFIGDQATLTLRVATVRGATVEVDPAAESWNGMTVVRVVSSVTRDEGGRSLHTFQLLVAPFAPGEFAFAPAVNVIADSFTTQRLLPQIVMRVLATLGGNEPLQLSPLSGPTGIDGAESPLLRPGIALGIVAVSVLVIGGGAAGARLVARRLRTPEKAFDHPAQVRDLGAAEALLVSDPVAAYRRLAAAVRAVLAERYDFPAPALTTRELHGRMEAEGVDRWEARLVSGFLEECDAVVYAGYRPAVERQQADLISAREIVEAAR